MSRLISWIDAHPEAFVCLASALIVLICLALSAFGLRGWALAGGLNGNGTVIR